MGQCLKCKLKRKIYVDSLCYVCYEDRQVRNLLADLPTPSSPYPQLIFDLYLTYIRRYNLKYHHLRQAKKLCAILESDPPQPFKSWFQVYQYDEKYPLPHKPGNKKGHAILKIGFMLEELGVLAPREDELGRQLENLLTAFTVKERECLELLLESLKTRRREQGTLHHCLMVLKNFKLWLGADTDLLTINQQTIERYLQSLREQNKNLVFIRSTFCALNQTYRFWKFQKIILVNPCQKVKTSRPSIKLSVVSDEQTKQLIDFIKRQDSDPESALILTLVLFYAFRSVDLAHAHVLFQNDSFSIILRRKPTSYGRRFYNREQCLILPQTPSWFLNLQKKFLAEWQERYAKTKKTYPHKPLLLPYHHNYNRPLSTTKVRERIKLATIAATGHYIQARILRQTCGHLYSKNGDASILSRLGWSPQFAFCYTWAPRTYFSPKV
jgi:hypothetical protein